jgi:hypothetical protein
MGGKPLMDLGHRSVLATACAGLLVVASLLCALEARAHTRSLSYSTWALDPQGANVTLSMAQLELTRLPWGLTRLPWGPVWGRQLDPNLAAYLTERLQLLAGGEPCPLRSGPRVLAAPPQRLAVAWRVECESSGPREIRSLLLQEVAPAHLHFARVQQEEEAVLERVLTSAEPSWRLAPESGADDDAPTAGSSLGSYVLIGISHIGTGPDHLAFVLALILIAARIGELATVITGFTVAHSITLAVAAFGLAKPEAQEIGALVGLSIILVAAENTFLLSGRPRSIPRVLTAGLGVTALLAALGFGGMGALTLAGMTLFTLCYFDLLGRAERPARLRVAIAFAFGLVHGFGFAGVLVEISLPTSRLVPALLGFNLGVEIGQLVLVAALWPVVRDLARLREGRPHRILVEVGSALLCSVGTFWFLTRAFG